MDQHTDLMQLGVNFAECTMKQGIGGPFGAVVVKDDKIISVQSNSVLRDNDPTAHAEVNAIRQACKNLGTYDLSGCELYATGFPCPMCMSAIIWANIKKIYVSGLPEDAEEIGFRDDFIYKFIENECSNPDVVKVVNLNRAPAKMLYKKYIDESRVIY